MEIFKPSVLQQQAGVVLDSAAYPPKKLVLIHTSVALGASLLTTALNFFLSQQIAQTGGLSGMGLRSILSTIQSVMELGVTVALPFWEMGLIFAALCWINSQQAAPQSLLQGFRRFGAVLALQLMQGFLFFMIAIGILYLSIMLFMFSPLSASLMQIMEPVLQDLSVLQQMPVFTDEQMAAINQAILPMFVIFGVLYLLVALPLFYRLRFTGYSLMEGTNALYAMVHSMRVTKNHVFHLIRLDLHFWWFYLLQAVGLVLCFGDVLLTRIGIELPFSNNTAFFLFYILGALVQWLLLWQYQGKVRATYALAYKSFWQKPPTPREQNLP